MGATEWRAVFGYPGSLPNLQSRIEYGPWRSDRGEAERDRPWRPDESHGRVIGLQSREVGPPEDVWRR